MDSNFCCVYDKKPAAAFCFQGQVKVVVCKEHIEDCLSKRLDIYPLDSMRFINTPRDVATYRLCSNTALKGMGYSQGLRASLSQEFRAAVSTLNLAKESCYQALAESFQEVERRIQHIFELREKELDALEEEFRNFTKVKGTVLSDACLMMAQGSGYMPGLIGFVTWSSALEIAQSVTSAFKVTESTAAEIINRNLSPDTRTATLEQYLTDINILTQTDTIPTLEEATVLLEEAKSMWDNLPEEEQTQFQPLKSGMDEAQHRLQHSFKVAHMKQEHQLTTLLLLSRSKESITALAAEFYAEAEVSKGESDLESAESYSEVALTLNSNVFPQSLTTVNSHLQLALIYSTQGRLEEAESHLKSALETSLTVSPASIETAKTYRRLGDLYGDSERMEEAEQAYKEAVNIGVQFFPTSSETAATFNNLGIFYEALSRFEDAESAWLKAWEIWQANEDPRGLSLAYEYLKEMYTRMDRLEDIEKLTLGR